VSSAGAVHFRPAEPSDVPVLLEMMEEFYAYELLPWDEAVARAGIETLFAQPALGGTWVIDNGREAAGYFVLTFSFSLEFHGRFGFLDELYLREPYRGTGIGRLAIQHAAAECASLGARALRLEVTARNPRARRFYANLDFEDTGRTLLTRWVHHPLS
jgi:GNAT superfamily N-acetyltransferase